MPRSMRITTPTVGDAVSDLVTAFGDMAAAAGRWLATQPAAQDAPVYVERVRRASTDTLDEAGAWAEATAARTRERGSEVASAARTQLINLALVAGLLWWLDQMLSRERD